MKREKLQSGWINTIQETISVAKAQALSNKTEVEFDFNGINIVVNDVVNEKNLLRDYFNAHLMGWKEIGPNPAREYSNETISAIEAAKAEQDRKEAERRKAYEEKQAKKLEDFNKEVEGIEMEFSNKEGWDKSVAVNKDPYGKGIITYAENWAKLMQKHLAEGKTLEECYDKDSTAADVEGITGFMFGAATNILAHVWKHGQALRKIHNKQYGIEGEGVANPAVLIVSTKEK
jgi:hypothetical protein